MNLNPPFSLSFFFKGSPASSVSWWQDGQLIDDTYEEIIPGKSRNTMKVESLQREHRHTEFSCSGNNNNRSQALSKSVILDLYCEYIWDTVCWKVGPPNLRILVVLYNFKMETFLCIILWYSFSYENFFCKITILYVKHFSKTLSATIPFSLHHSRSFASKQ